MKKSIGIGLLILVCYVMRTPVIGKSVNYRSSLAERKLYDGIRRHKAAVILLDNQTVCHGRRGVRKKESSLQLAFNRLSKSGYYPRKAVAFMHINTQTPIGKLFVKDNNITIDTFPSIVLFSDGIPLEDQHGLITVSGNTDRNQLKKTIDAYLNVDIAKYVQEERNFKQYQDIIRDRAHVYYSPYFSKVANPWNGYWGWPYYGMSQGHYGGNAGVVSNGGGLSFFGANY
ncbi:MAG: hypothetical protein WD055_06220 [Candidatus Dependentiae bacterium]